MEDVLLFRLGKIGIIGLGINDAEVRFDGPNGYIDHLAAFLESKAAQTKGNPVFPLSPQTAFIQRKAEKSYKVTKKQEKSQIVAKI
jgi:hypothetical protein